MKYLCIILIALFAGGCKPQSDSKPVSSSPAIQIQSNANEEKTVDALQKEVDAENAAFESKHEQDQLKLSDNDRTRRGFLNSKDVLVEKSTNMRMRMSTSEVIKNGQTITVRDLQFIENEKIFDFNMGIASACRDASFKVKKSTADWIELMDMCFDADDSKNQYFWMIYDRKTRTLTELYIMNGASEFQRIRNKDPEVINYKNGAYSIFYPHLKDTMSFNVSTLDGDCHWISGEGDMDNAEKGCPVSNVRDRIENGTLQKSPPSSSAN